mgnify:CR=1 FL=1
MSNHRSASRPTRTHSDARAEILAGLAARKWSVKPALKVPHATSPDEEVRLWFKPQAVYFTTGRGQHDFDRARTISYDLDLRTMTVEEVVEVARRLAHRDNIFIGW